MTIADALLAIQRFLHCSHFRSLCVTGTHFGQFEDHLFRRLQDSASQLDMRASGLLHDIQRGRGEEEAHDFLGLYYVKDRCIGVGGLELAQFVFDSVVCKVDPDRQPRWR